MPSQKLVVPEIVPVVICTTLISIVSLFVHPLASVTVRINSEVDVGATVIFAVV